MSSSFFRTSIATVILAVLIAPAAWASGPPISFQKSVGSLANVPMKTAPTPELAAVRAEDAAREASGVPGPYRFAVKLPVDYQPATDGEWQTLGDGSRLWRLRIQSPGALSLILTLDQFDLPEGASFWFYSPDGSNIRGPYQRSDAKNGRLWTPILEGEVGVVELHEPAAVIGQSKLQITAISHGYRGFYEKGNQGSCNVDVVCSQGDAWRDQIRSVVVYSLSGVDRCSGVLVNNTAKDGKPLLLSAEHCSFSGQFPDVTVYFNFESPTCGAHSGGSMSQSLNGATLRAIDDVSDFALLELDDDPPEEFNVYFSGWDATESALTSGVAGIHHPSIGEKSISFENDQVFSSTDSDVWPSTHWKITDWDSGTTEGGSSGSPIFDKSNHLVVGTLSGGFAACGNNDSDWYGKISEHFDRGLRQFLDPINTGKNTLEGMDPSTGLCQDSNTMRCLNDNRFAVSIRWKDFEGLEGDAKIVQDSDDSSLWWFFTSTNWEALVKVLDGCSFNNHYWVFSAAVTNVEFTLTVTDTATGITKTWFNPLGVSAAAVTDTEAFATCP